MERTEITRKLRMPRVDQKRCVLCGDCVENCPHNVLALVADKLVFARPLNCTYCATCEMSCPHDAVACDFSIQWAG